MSAAEYTSINDPSMKRAPVTAMKKPPGFIVEAVFCSVTLFLFKLYSDQAFDALSFTTVLIPMMAFFILSIVFNVLKFLKLLHTEELDEDAGLLSPKQIKLLFTMARNLIAYFALYMLAGELDDHLTHKELSNSSLLPGVCAVQAAFLI